MKRIIFFDTEVSESTKQILDYGALDPDGDFIHTPCAADFAEFIRKSEFLCGHNVFQFDLVHLKGQMENDFSPYVPENRNVIDTLYWSALLFPEHPYHHLVKDDKLESEERNNPLNDAKKAQHLFYDEVETFRKLPDSLKEVYYGLLAQQKEFGAFFRFLGYQGTVRDAVTAGKIRMPSVGLKNFSGIQTIGISTGFLCKGKRCRRRLKGNPCLRCSRRAGGNQ